MKQPQTLEQAIQMTTPIVNKLAHKWKRNHYGMFADLQQEGFLGVCEAWKRFDPKANVKFSTYAWWWIRAHIRGMAMGNWEYQNNTASEAAMVYGNEETYEFSDRLLSVLRQIEKLPTNERQMYQMRMDGYTFDEIAKEIGADSLHKVRNSIMKINEQLEAA